MAKFYETTIILFLLFCFKTTFTQNQCIYRQYIRPEQQYRLNSPSFPNYYRPGTDCTWFFTTAPDYEVRLNCHHVDLPMNGVNCIDFLAVSAEQVIIHCRPFSVHGSTVKMRLASSWWSWGGVFACDITADKKSTVNPQPIGKCSCGWTFMPRIVGGTDAEVNEFPSMALLIFVPKREQHCGATIIADRVALSAAHCFYTHKEPNNYGLLIGEHDTSRGNETNSTNLLRVSDIIVHKASNLKGGNDIALVITADVIEFSARVGPACLPFSIDKEKIIGQYVTITGWGTLESGGRLPKVLQKVRVQLVEDSRCNDTYFDRNNEYKSPEQHICTFTPGKDACQMDSGGPVYYFDPYTNRYAVVGIVSYGVDCGYVPAINTNVHHYIPWIKANIPSDVQLCGV